MRTIHDVTYEHPQYFGVGRKHNFSCTCGAKSQPTSDLDDAKRAGAQHAGQHAHAAVAAEVDHG